MTNRNIYSAAFCIVFLLFSVFMAAQTRTMVSATVDRSQILIGEPIRLRLEAHIPENEPIRFFHTDSLPHFELLEKGAIDTSDTKEGSVLSQLIRITSFDSGHWVIPAFSLRGGPATDTIGIDVGFSPFDPEQPYHDIKDIIEVKPEEKAKKQWWWFAAGGALLLVLALILVWALRKKKPVVSQAPPPDPYRAAMGQLEKLLSEQNSPKLFYTKLVDIFRVYTLARKGIHSMQKTTDDLIVQLQSLGLPKEQFDELSQALRLSDFVKFARYTPATEDHRATFKTIKKAIDTIEQLK